MSQAPTVGRAWRHWRDQFATAQLATPALDARVLAQHVLGIDGARLAIIEREPIAEAALQTLNRLAERRLAGEPVARIVGGKEFFDRTFLLNAGTLVPRPETESLVETGVALLSSSEPSRLLELGVGSGCVTVSILCERDMAKAVATDLAASALEIAAVNADVHGVRSRLELRQGAWFAPLAPDERFDLIVSNPPYIASAVIAELAPEVRDHDPVLALDGGADGLNAYRAIAADAKRFLAPTGFVALEIGYDQAESVTLLFEAAGFHLHRCVHDLGGHARVLVFDQGQ